MGACYVIEKSRNYFLQGVTADVWWFPGTNADDPCFTYWNKADASKLPIQLWGVISNGSDGGAIIDYYDFTPGKIPDGIATEHYFYHTYMTILQTSK